MPKNLRGSLDPGPAPIQKICNGHVWTVPKNMPAKFEVCSFECIVSRQQ